MSRRYVHSLYRSPIDLPERAVGDFAIRYATVKDEVIIVGFREALMRGIRPLKAELDAPIRIHQLVEKNGVWMSDAPQELNQICEALHSFRPAGRVLIGSLGLGILAKIVAAEPEVSEVIVVERSPEVIELAKADGYTVVQADLREFVETASGFDTAMLDTWAGTGEATWWDEVVPLRRALTRNGLAPRRIWCWAEDQMLGQVRRHLAGPRHWKSKRLPPMTVREVEYFLTRIGSARWEALYGDKVEKEKSDG